MKFYRLTACRTGLKSVWIAYEKKISYALNVENQKDIIQVDQSDLPFHVELENLEQFNMTLTRNNYSSTGMRIHIKRNSLGLLIGGYYGPTIIFSTLSLVSYSIKADIVSN